MTTRLWWGAVLLAGLAGCDDPLSEEFAPVGCRTGPQPCDEGEVCFEGECVPTADLEGEPPDADDFRVQVQPERDNLVADRTHADNRMIVRLRVHGDDGEGFSGKVLLRANPFDAATFDPTVVEMKEGLGATRVRACDRGDPGCPERFRIDVALDEYPTVVIGSGDAIRIDHGRRRAADAAAARPGPADAGAQ